MTELDQKIVRLMKGPTPPQTVKELVEACQPCERNTVFSKISGLLNSGELTREDLPWRRDKDNRTKAGRPRDQKLKSLEKTVLAWVAESGKDRTAAGKLLLELRQISQEVLGPPVPDDKPATIAALRQQLAAVGKEWALEAFDLTWPGCVILEARSEEGIDLGTVAAR